MVKIDEYGNIQVTRGDILQLKISAKNKDGSDFTFAVNDVVRFKVTEANNVENVVIEKSLTVDTEGTNVIISLTGEDTKIGELINKPVNYWYEVELNPDTNPQTIIGYTLENKAKIFTLLPEGGDI